MKRLLINLLYPFIVLFALILLWYLCSLIVNTSLILPNPFICIKEAFKYFLKLSFYKVLLFTIIRSLVSFLLSFILAFLLVLLGLKFQKVNHILEIIIAIIRGIPTMAIILILIIWMRSSLTPIIVAFIVSLPIIYQSLKSSFKMVDTDLLEMASIYNLTKKKKVYIYYNETLGSIFDIISSNLSLNLKLVIAAEAMALSKNAIGTLMQYDKVYLETEKLFALAIIAVILGFLIEVIVKIVKRHVVRYQNA